MASAALSCPKCWRDLPGSPADWSALTVCPNCSIPLEVTIFPACGRGPVLGRSGENRMTQSDAACFFHPSKKAAVPCDQCGRFLCALCDLPIEGRHVCPTCLNSPAQPQSTPKNDSRTNSGMDRERTRWDRIVWALVLIPWVTLFFAALAPFTSLFALGLGCWKLNSPASRIHRSRLRLILGMVVAAVVCAGAAALVVTAF